MLNRKLFSIIISIFFCISSFGQMTSNEAHPLYKIDKELKLGNKDALFEIAPYFDSKKELEERFAYNHISARNESEVAKRIVEVNSIFTDAEISIDENTSSQDFLKFLNANLKNITYSKYAKAFLITPLETRSVNIRFREITEEKRLKLKDEYQGILRLLANQEIESLIKNKDPKSLFIIASELFKERDWLNTIGNGSNKGEYIKLLQILTNVEIEVEGDYNKKTWHIEEEFYPIAALNLLCYLSENYSRFEWNENKKIFENNDIKIITIGKENSLFQLLRSKNDSIALNAFIQLTTCNPAKVTELANEYLQADLDHNYAIPQFPYKFLKQLVALTDYCNSNNIDFVGTEILRHKIKILKSDLSFPERRKLENQLINSLTLDNITAFEYWVLIYEKSWDLIYSAGRILDIFYSKNWNSLLINKKHLDCYLKKSELFNKLGIIGVCNNYLKKFSNSTPSTLSLLENYKTNDNNIIGQIEKIVSLNSTFQKKEKGIISWDGNKDCEVKDLKNKLDEHLRNVRDSSETENAISKLLSQINYSQIPTALEAIENYPFHTQWKKYSFMERDFGFFMVGDFDKKETRDKFLNLYSKFSEFQLYSYYLDKAGIDYKTSDNKLDFDKIYELIKYDVVVAFVGGGGGKKDNEVYAIIKLLELTFKTTLGYPAKLCSSNNIYACDSDERVKSWMTYLNDNKLLKKNHNEPISFHYE